MDKVKLQTIFVVLIAIFFGIVLVRENKTNPLINEIMQNQAKILKSQKAMNDILSSKSNIGGDDQSLANRVLALETQIRTLRDEVMKLKAQGPSPSVAQKPVAPPAMDDTVYTIPIDHSSVEGNPNAPITITEFSDFQCPYSARFHPEMAAVLKAFPGKVKVVIKNFPLSFHKQSMSAAKAAFAAGEQGKYFEMVNLLLKNQRELSDATYEKLASELGLDVEKFKKDYKEKDAVWEKYINQDKQLGAKVGVRGTPTFYINGKKTRARTIAAYKQEIEQILKSSK